jgi:glutamate dehydrogenase (NAD(P)+)
MSQTQQTNQLKIVGQVRSVQKLVESTDEMMERIVSINRFLECALPVKMDNGKIRMFTAYRSQHNNARGPHKGGLRFHKDVDAPTIQELSIEMSLKTAVVDIPVGGGKGGVRVNTKELSEVEIERVARAYMRAFASFIGDDVDVPAPDVGTNPHLMAVMLDEYETMTGHKNPGVITGKPLSVGGSQARGYSTAQGGVYVLEEAVKKIDLSKNATVAIEGFGNAGYHVGRILSEKGYKIISVSDSQGVLTNTDGLDIEKVWKHKQKNGTVSDFEGGKSGNEGEAYKADIYIPAALSDSVTKTIAEKLEAKIVLELANGPLTEEADKILDDKKVLVIPDILANAGGVIVSYFEQVQNAQNYYWKEKEVLEKLQEKISNAFRDVWEKKEKHKTSMRRGAIALAVERLIEATEERGEK